MSRSGFLLHRASLLALGLSIAACSLADGQRRDLSIDVATLDLRWDHTRVDRDPTSPDRQLSEQTVGDQLTSDTGIPDQSPPLCVGPSPIVASCANGFCAIPAGCFFMGSSPSQLCQGADETQHVVTLTHAFEISATEVTQAEFQMRMTYNPSALASCGGTCPVENETWHEAAAYANALSTFKGLVPCYACTGSGGSVGCTPASSYTSGTLTIYDCPGYRLPTEAEWEYAYRAGTSTDFYSGPITNCSGTDSAAETIGWYFQVSPQQVAQKTANAWGLYDMAGNVEEWVHDGYAPYSAGSVKNPVLATSGPSAYSGRGGQWSGEPADLRAADRNPKTGTAHQSDMGFRVVRSL